MDFHKTRTFRFQSYFLKMFLSFNEEILQLPEMVLTKEMNRDYTKFINFLMYEVYNAIFQKKFPIVLPKMNKILHLSIKKRIGDCFFFSKR